jgi:hypothetical protein
VPLREGVAGASQAELIMIERSLPHGHVAAVLDCARDRGAEAWFASAGRLRPMLLALTVSRLIEPACRVL